ncbi:hypothetical protein AGRA3207_000988 [Actinomadura graeca]|uniref:Peptidase inhibitor family I36 n=1 Tax=Actinomadura graeca TaxID=2750812 RepID=A0ABX8QQ56_9ACTN|nr:hypothetical protein [Actinomadura graeca]QXJ20299.1 hypothetical protein AGRA3207_000988 [Actinomadura graeca]
MENRGRTLVVALAAAGGMVGFAVAGVPANSASRYVGTPGQESRCRDHDSVLACYYYSEWTSAYWGKGVNDPDLGDNRYFAGTGTGADQVVRNNSRRMVCKVQVPTRCESFYSTNYMGNMDWMYNGERGELSYTRNDNASVMIR